MARIAGIELSDNLKVGYGLTKIKGIGWSLSKKIIKEAKIDSNTRLSQLTADQMMAISGVLDKILTEGELFRVVKGNIARLKTIGSYRGMRHSKGLPVRGQRTRHNARQKRGKRKTVGAFKKEALAKTQTVKSETK